MTPRRQANRFSAMSGRMAAIVGRCNLSDFGRPYPDRRRVLRGGGIGGNEKVEEVGVGVSHGPVNEPSASVSTESASMIGGPLLSGPSPSTDRLGRSDFGAVHPAFQRVAVHNSH